MRLHRTAALAGTPARDADGDGAAGAAPLSRTTGAV
jgi:hypothetical protein